MLRTPLYNLHTRLGAKMVDFAGWEMPLLFTSIIEEHRHTRSAASVFDVSHMGRIELTGPDAERLLEYVCTRRLGDAVVGQSRYSHVCREDGGILDDVIVSRFEDHWLMICNASNRERIVAWLRQHATGRNLEISDRTESTMMVAIQGPLAIGLLGRLLPVSVSDLKRYHFCSGNYLFTPYAVFRSGYTGEDGAEIILPANVAQLVGGHLVGDEVENHSLKPAGLGARDTLRLEAGMPLYGHELHENTDSLSAGLAWCVDLNKDFIGVEALRRISQAGPSRKLVGLELAGRRIARPHSTVLSENKPVGEVTSGTFSPTLERSIAMACVDAAQAQEGRPFTVDMGGKQAEATIVRLPFYKRKTGS
ncbi:MAG: glycine cleavage system aminomethyltransferase GcvT [Planctomycetes bacterium]|nr:glycine cleavage system aminomethyltransferase GcvT [Planctomycetota bacterium]